MSHTRLRMTILYSEDGDSKDYFGEPARQPRESPSRRRFRVSMGKTVRTKRRNEADPSDLERFVQLTTSNEILARYKRRLGLWPGRWSQLRRSVQQILRGRQGTSNPGRSIPCPRLPGRGSTLRRKRGSTAGHQVYP